MAATKISSNYHCRDRLRGVIHASRANHAGRRLVPAQQHNLRPEHRVRQLLHGRTAGECPGLWAPPSQSPAVWQAMVSLQMSDAGR